MKLAHVRRHLVSVVCVLAASAGVASLSACSSIQEGTIGSYYTMSKEN